MLSKQQLGPGKLAFKWPLFFGILPRSRSFATSSIILEASNQKSSKTTGNSEQKSLFQMAEPYWKSLNQQLKGYKDRLNRIRGQLTVHVKKAQDSIREANKKLAEQDRDRMDNRLNYDTDVETSGKIRDLPSQREFHRRQWARKLEFYLDSLQETVLTATKALNDVTGYSSIQTLRKSIDLMEERLEKDRSYLRSLKEKYAAAIETRTESQREVNELLQRKSSWSPVDLERFTELYKSDAMNLKREQELKEEVKDREVKQEELINDLYHAILTRYHEEQIWSDKIRRTSTWGTFILMGVNIILFLVFQLLLEPWKRRRLTRSFEDKVKQALDQYTVEQNQKLEEFSINLKDSKQSSQQMAHSASKTRGIIIPDTDMKTEPAAEQEDSPITVPLAKEKNSSFRDLVNKFSINDLSLSSIFQWLRNFGQKFKPPITLQLNSVIELSSIELYVYSALLMILGAVTGALL